MFEINYVYFKEYFGMVLKFIFVSFRAFSVRLGQKKTKLLISNRWDSAIIAQAII